MRIRKRTPKWNRILCSLLPGIIASGGGAVAPPGNAFGDPFYDSVVANLHFDAADASTTFTDQKGHTFTGSGNAQIDTAQSKFGGSSLLLDGTGDYLTSADSADWEFGSGDFTINLWVRFNGDPGTATVTFLSHWNTTGNQRGWVFALSNNNLRFQWSTDGSAASTLQGAWNPATATWYYLSAVRRSGVLYLFADGLLLNSGAVTATFFNSTAALEIGSHSAGTETLNGWIDDVRITKAARYTTNFSKPAHAHGDEVTAIGDEFYSQTVSVLHLDTDFSDQKSVSWSANGNAAITSAQSVFGGSSLVLDGNDDWLEATNGNFAWGTGDFTIECWARFNAFAGNNFVFTFGGGWGVYRLSSNGTWGVFDGVSTNPITTAVSPSTGVWYHVALCRRGTTMRLFIDGVQIGSATNSTNFSNTTIRIGAQPAGTGDFNGWIDDFRATAFARYVGAFQFPVLAHPDRLGDPYFADVISINHWDGSNGSTTYTDQIVGRTWTNVTGAAALDTSQFKFGTAALKLPGTASNHVDSDSGGSWAFGTNDFTIEFWFRVATIGTWMLWDQRTSLSQPRPCMFLQSSTLLYFVNNAVRITGGNLTAATWQHIAVSRVAGSTRLFIDGVQQGSTYADATDYTAGRVSLGTAGDSPGFGTHAGAYDDIRVTNGVGRYAANFSPPPAAFLNAA